MGSMDTSRIGQFLGLTPKVTGITESNAKQSGGFADLLFGVMSKRASTLQPPVSASKVTTILPLEHRPDAVEPLSARPLTSQRILERANGVRGNDQAAAPADQSSGAPGTGNTGNNIVGGKKPEATETAASDCAQQGEAVDAAPPAEGVEIGEEPGEDLDLQTGTEGAEGQDGGTGEQGADQSLEQQPQAAVIEIRQPTSETPQIVAAIAVPGTVPVEGGSAAPETMGDNSASVAPTQPIAGAQPAEEEIADAQPALPIAGEAVPAEGDTAAVATAAGQIETSAEDDGKTAAAAEMALSLVEESSTGEAEAKAAVAARQTEQRQEDSPGTFRRSAQTPRQRAAAASAGTTGAPTQAAAQNATGQNAAGQATAGAVSTGATSTVLPLSPLGFEGEPGTISGLPGWNLNLAQGNAAKRADFVANLRQHLQNLPAREQVALGIQRAARDGSGSITLQLSPSELGRIHVKLDIDEEKNVRAAVSVERPATLDLLQRDVKALERALQDAGLKMDQGDLSFSLQQGGDSDSFARQFGSGGGDLAQMLADEDELTAELAAQSAIVATGDGLVDVQI